jgi:hypothetical protein
MPAKWVFPSILTNADAGFPRISRIVPLLAWRGGCDVALCDRRNRHQHFLKRDTVFFNALVYSESSAFRFPSARSSNQPSHLIGGQHGQESEEGGEEGSAEEGEERGEEDREEDEEGRQEEVTSPSASAGSFDAGERHKGRSFEFAARSTFSM